MNKEHTKRGSVRLQLYLLTFTPLLCTILILSLISVKAVKNGMQNEVMNGLSDMAYGVQAAYNLVDPGDYSIKDNKLYKGVSNLSDNIDMLDNFTISSDTEVTVFYQDTRYLTTLTDSKSGDRLVGTTANKEVCDRVLTGHKIYQSTNVSIDGNPYFGYYIPLTNPSTDEVVGMVFAGKPQAETLDFINQKIRTIVLISIGLLLIAMLLALYFARKLSGAIQKAEHMLVTLSSGDLNFEIPDFLLAKRNELGDMARAVQTVQNEIKNVIAQVLATSESLLGTSRQMDDTAKSTASTAQDISMAVDGIAEGATSQAEEVDTATHNIVEIGNEISAIAEKAANLDEASTQMKQASQTASENISLLTQYSRDMVGAIESINQQVLATNTSAQDIRQAVLAISDIASQTNLLSLNASIEAARAGEQGKGFAVVASEISNLAAQSNASSKEIEGIVTKLAQESEKSVEVMNHVKEMIDTQQKMLSDTAAQFFKVDEGIDLSRTEAQSIKERSTSCNDSKEGIVDGMSNLSAISEENAASTQETTASMEMLSHTIDSLAEESQKVYDLVIQLQEKMSFWKVS
ncbi:MAG: methyl-accepting chemotaxis protein [Lachnospiraceae bacterium]|nr:methyl-accepting chemotaxis protein [Lachnospiraceae bacterium]